MFSHRLSYCCWHYYIYEAQQKKTFIVCILFLATSIMFHFMVAAESRHVEERDVKNDLPMVSWYLLRYSITLTTVTTTVMSPVSYLACSCEHTKVPSRRPTTSALKMTRATGSSVATLAWSHRTLQVRGGEQGEFMRRPGWVDTWDNGTGGREW